MVILGELIGGLWYLVPLVVTLGVGAILVLGPIWLLAVGGRGLWRNLMARNPAVRRALFESGLESANLSSELGSRLRQVADQDVDAALAVLHHQLTLTEAEHRLKR